MRDSLFIFVFQKSLGKYLQKGGVFMNGKQVRKQIFDNFNKFINSQEVEPSEVCMFISRLLSEHGYRGSYGTGCYGKEYVLQDNDFEDD